MITSPLYINLRQLSDNYDSLPYKPALFLDMLLYNLQINFKTYLMVDNEIKDSLTRLEEAYINSFEYKTIYREKNWMVVGLVTTLLSLVTALAIMGY